MCHVTIFWKRKKRKKRFNLKCHLNHLSINFLFHIVTVRNEKKFLIVSHDLSTDKQNKIHRWIRNSTWSDKSHSKKNLDKNSGNGVGIANLDHLSISCPSYSFLWKSNPPMNVFLCEIMENFIGTDFYCTNLKWCWFCVFWIVSLMCKYMTSYLWLMLFEFLNQTFRRPSVVLYKKHTIKAPRAFLWSI